MDLLRTCPIPFFVVIHSLPISAVLQNFCDTTREGVCMKCVMEAKMFACFFKKAEELTRCLLAAPVMSLCLVIALFGFIAVAPCYPQKALEREFVGTINHTLGIRIKLSQADGALTGSYLYEKIGKSLRLEGKMKRDADFSLTETDERGNTTGSFEGEFVSKDWIEGTWYSPDRKKSMVFSAWVPGGEQAPISTAGDKISGQYKRMVRGKIDRHTATLDIWRLRDGRVRVKGDAIWVGDPKTGNVNIGDVDGIFSVQDSKVLYKEKDACSFTIHLRADSLTVTDDNMKCGGMNVTFDGEYKKAGKPGSR